MCTGTRCFLRLVCLVGILASAVLGMPEMSVAIPSDEQCAANPDMCARAFGGGRKPASPQPVAPPPPSSPPALPPSNPVSCLKHLFDGSFQRGNVPPSQYYSVAATTFSRANNPRIHSSQTGLVVQEISGVASQGAMDLALVPVHLPHGAVIREIAVALHDTSMKENLQVLLARTMPDLPQGSAQLMALESDCMQSAALTTMAATGLAIPFDSKYAHFLKLSVVQAKAPGMSAPSPQVSVYAIRIGYTMQ